MAGQPVFQTSSTPRPTPARRRTLREALRMRDPFPPWEGIGFNAREYQEGRLRGRVGTIAGTAANAPPAAYFFGVLGFSASVFSSMRARPYADRARSP